MGYLSLEKEPVVIQVSDFGDRFWTIPVYDARTDQISEVGLQYGSNPTRAEPNPVLPVEPVGSPAASERKFTVAYCTQC